MQYAHQTSTSDVSLTPVPSAQASPHAAWVLSFEQISPQDFLQVGGKGASLARMFQAQLPVPPGFVVTSAAYAQHVQGALWQKIEQRLKGVVSSDPDAVEQACTDIRTWLMATPLSQSVREAIRSAYARLHQQLESALSTSRGGQGVSTEALRGEPSDASLSWPMAVRSSATAEDGPEASFAGQQETFLHVQGLDALYHSIQACQASLWTPRSVEYRLKMGFTHAEVQLAVVVQAMVQADVAGVMFTANPLTGAEDEPMITASYGLGEAVVSGMVNPDTIRFKGEKVVQYAVGSKALRIVPSPETSGRSPSPSHGGTVTEPVPEALRTQRCLYDQQLNGLLQLGHKAAQLYGAPQDLEWAISEGTLFLLQARPITTPPPLPDDAAPELPRHMHTSLKDHFPEPPLPIDMMVMLPVLRGLFSMFTLLGIQGPDGDALLTERGQGYLGLKLRTLRPTLRTLWRLPTLLLRILGARDLEAWPKYYHQQRDLLDAWEKRAHASQPSPALMAILQEMHQAQIELWPQRFISVGPAVVSVGLLQAMTRLAVGEAEAANVSRALMSGIHYHTALRNEEVNRLAELQRKLGRHSPQYQAEFQAFLLKHRDVPSSGMLPVPGIPGWQERPSVPEGLIEAVVRSLDSSAGKASTEPDLTWEQARDKVLSGLPRLLHGRFRRMLEVARSGLVMREQAYELLERYSGIIRRTGLTLGQQLYKRGSLESANDLFYLLLSELPTVIAAQDPPQVNSVQGLIRRRRRAWRQLSHAHQRGVHWLYASASMQPPPSRLPPTGDVILVGDGASHGKAVGKVRLIRDASEFSTFQTGEVLVTAATAPTWTPLFRLAAGVITDVGGVQSHAAIVAREFGIPAVLGTEAATQTLKTGDWVEVDGNTGKVSRVSRPPEA